MVKQTEPTTEFLAQKRIAVAGVSRTPGGSHGANIVYTSLKKAGYEVFPVNPNADEVEGDRCYHNIGSIPGGVDAVVVGTAAAQSADVVRECAEQGISRAWLHRSFGSGSVSDEAVAVGRERGVNVIAGGCPLMFVQGADIGHRCMRLVLNLTHGLPKSA